MKPDSATNLTNARRIATLLYVLPLVAFPLLGRLVKTQAAVNPQVLRLLGLALLLVAVGDYAVSLIVEHKLLPQAQRASPQAPGPAFVAAIIVSALGASLATYGFVLTLLGAPGFGAALYVLCAAHGLHLMLRWPRYEQAAHQPPDSPL